MTKAPNSRSFKDLELSGWQAKAEGYDGFAGNVTTQAVEYLLDAAAVTASKHVLDVACGPAYGAAGAVTRGERNRIGLRAFDGGAGFQEIPERGVPRG